MEPLSSSEDDILCAFFLSSEQRGLLLTQALEETGQSLGFYLGGGGR